MSMDIRIEYQSTPDPMWVATLIRDGEPWYLDGAVVGCDDSPGSAVEDLIGICIWLVAFGQNALTNGPIDDEDRFWLEMIVEPLLWKWDGPSMGLHARVVTESNRWQIAAELWCRDKVSDVDRQLQIMRRHQS